MLFDSLSKGCYITKFRICLNDSVLWKMLNFVIFSHERASGDFYGKNKRWKHGEMNQWFYVFVSSCRSESTNVIMPFRWSSAPAASPFRCLRWNNPLDYLFFLQIFRCACICFSWFHQNVCTSRQYVTYFIILREKDDKIFVNAKKKLYFCGSNW